MTDAESHVKKTKAKKNSDEEEARLVEFDDNTHRRTWMMN